MQIVRSIRLTLVVVAVSTATLAGACSSSSTPQQSSADSGADTTSGEEAGTDAPPPGEGGRDTGPDSAADAGPDANADARLDAPAGDGPEGEAGVVAIASDVAQGTAIATDGVNVYWTQFLPTDAGSTYGQLEKVPVAGGPETTVATTPATVFPIALAIDATRAYFSTNAGDWCLYSVPLAGGPVGHVSCSVQEVGIVLDSTYAYFVDTSGNAVSKVSLGVVDAGYSDQGTKLTFNNGMPVDLALAGGHLYWINGGQGTISTVAANVTSPTVPTDIVSPDPDAGSDEWANGTTGEELTSDGVNLYWARYPGTGGVPSGAVLKVPVAGGRPVEVYDAGTGTAYAVRSDGTNVYWIVYVAPASYTIMAQPVGGGTTRVVASLPGGGDMAFDATSLYVLGKPYLWRVPK